MKFTTGVVLAAIAVAGASAESSKTQTVDPSTLTHVDPSTIVGLGPALRPGMPGYGQNAQFNKAWAEYLAKEGKPSTSGSSNYYTVDPKSLPIENPANLQGLGPQTQGRSLKASGATTTTFNPASQQTIDPAQLEGLGPQTPAGDNPKIKQAMKELAGSTDGSSNYLTIDPKSLHTMNPANIAGLGPAVLPGMPGYGKNEKANKAWKEFLEKEGASTSSSGSAASNCAQVCPEMYQPVCGSDGVTYSNSCFLGLATCKNPEKHITKASDDACSKTTLH